jgi:hypothetical protein
VYKHALRIAQPRLERYAAERIARYLRERKERLARAAEEQVEKLPSAEELEELAAPPAEPEEEPVAESKSGLWSALAGLILGIAVVLILARALLEPEDMDSSHNWG